MINKFHASLSCIVHDKCSIRLLNLWSLFGRPKQGISIVRLTKFRGLKVLCWNHDRLFSRIYNNLHLTIDLLVTNRGTYTGSILRGLENDIHWRKPQVEPNRNASKPVKDCVLEFFQKEFQATKFKAKISNERTLLRESVLVAQWSRRSKLCNRMQNVEWIEITENLNFGIFINKY